MVSRANVGRAVVSEWTLCYVWRNRGRGWLYGVGIAAAFRRNLELSLHLFGAGGLPQHLLHEWQSASQHEALQHCSFETVGDGYLDPIWVLSVRSRAFRGPACHVGQASCST